MKQRTAAGAAATALAWAAWTAGAAEGLIGADLSAFRDPTGEWKVVADAAKVPDNGARLSAKDGAGAMYNGPNGRTVDILTKEEFGDAEVHVEFLVPEKSNSGVYLMGRYEVQILDSFGVEKPGHGDCGGIYQRWADDRGFEGRPPRVNASRPPGQWQSYDMLFRAPRFDAAGRKVANARFEKVVHNGTVIHEGQEVTGPTRAARYNDEKALGPLMIQGDHGPVAIRNLRIAPWTNGLANPFFAMDTYTQRPYPNGTMPREQQFDLVRGIGYAGITWTAEDPARVKAAAEAAWARGLRMHAIYVGATLTKERLEPDPRLREIMGALKGYDTIVWLHITSKDFPRSSPEGDAIAVPGLREVAGWAEAAGLRVAIYPHVGDWTERFQDAVRLAGKVDRWNFGAGFNLCHSLKVGDEARILELLREAGPRLFVVTINGADANASAAGWDRLIQTLDRGTYDLRPLLRTLREIGFHGPIGVQGYGIPGDPADNLRRTWSSWQGILNGL